MKLFVGIVLMGLMCVYSLVSDYRQEQEFLNKFKQFSTNYRLDEDTHRSVASWHGGASGQNNFFVIIPYDDHNKKIINGTWLISSFVDSKGTEYPFNIRTKLKLLENGQVILADDERMIFKVSEIGQGNKTLQLIRFFGNKSEIVKATRVFERKISQVVNKRQSSLKKRKTKKGEQQKVKGVTLVDSELKLVKAIVPSFSKVPLYSISVSGNVTLRDTTLENFFIRLKNEKEEEVELEFSYADILNGGQFSFEGEESSIQGIFTNDGKSSYRMRFATGPLSGSILNFVKEGVDAKAIFESVKEKPKPVSAREINRKQNKLLKQRSSSVKNIQGYEFSQVSN